MISADRRDWSGDSDFAFAQVELDGLLFARNTLLRVNDFVFGMTPNINQILLAQIL